MFARQSMHLQVILFRFRFPEDGQKSEWRMRFLNKRSFGNNNNTFFINRSIYKVSKCSIYSAVVLLEHLFECLFFELEKVNFFPQTSHPYGFTPVWMRRCSIIFLLWPNDFPQCSHLCGFSPVWVSLCCFKVLFRAKDIPHTSQEKGFSPVCMRTCRVRLFFCAQVNGQKVQEKGCSPV